MTQLLHSFVSALVISLAFFGGIALACYGIWLASPALGFLITGAVLAFLAVRFERSA